MSGNEARGISENSNDKESIWGSTKDACTTALRALERRENKSNGTENRKLYTRDM